MQYRSAGLDPVATLVTNPVDRLGSGLGKIRVHFSVGFGVNVVKKESEAHVEWKTPMRWEWARRLWWRCGGREWNQTLTRDSWLYTERSRHSERSDTSDGLPLSLVSLPGHLVCPLLSFSCPRYHFLFLCFFLSLSGAENWLQAQGTELFQGRIKVRTMMARKLGVVGVAVEFGG